MTISLYYEQNYQQARMKLEVPEDEFSLMIEADYQAQRQELLPGDAAPRRRSPQEILDERINKPTYNSHHRETRRHISYESLDPKGERLASGFDLEDTVLSGMYSDLREAMKTLTPDQRALLRRIYVRGDAHRTIAEEEGLSVSAVSKRLARIYALLREEMERQRNG